MASSVPDYRPEGVPHDYASAWDDEVPASPGADSQNDNEETDSSGPRRRQDDDDDIRTSSRGTRPNSQSKYAKGLQKACDQALQHIKEQHIISTSEWAAPLTAAPSAISVMAILLKTADARAAAGLTVSSVDVMDSHNVVGKLPSEYFQTNLQYCADIGRLAFLEAQNGMNRIQAISRRMIGEEGRIACAIDLLEDPEDAKYDLIPEINAIKESATKCLDTAKDISEKFSYWHLVILHLKRCSLEKQGVVIRQQEVLEEDELRTNAKQTEWNEKQRALEALISDLRARMTATSRELDDAKGLVRELERLPPIQEPSYIDEYARTESLIPSQEFQPRSRGFFVSTWEFFVGESQTRRESDDAEHRAHQSVAQKQRAELVEKERQRRQEARQAAEKRLNKTLDDKRRLDKAIDDAYKELSLSRDRLAEAKANLEKSKAQMEQLRAKALELKDIEVILKTSSDQLGHLKGQIEPLVDFFNSILVGIDQGISENAKVFLRPIERRIQENTTNPEEVTLNKLGRAAKRNMMGAALQMQGHFSAIADISGAYITISSKYIRPAINRMEALSTCSDAEWRSKSDEFIMDCITWSHEIEEIAQRTTSEAPKNMKKHMDALQRRAIEAAE